MRSSRHELLAVRGELHVDDDEWAGHCDVGDVRSQCQVEDVDPLLELKKQLVFAGAETNSVDTCAVSEVASERFRDRSSVGRFPYTDPESATRRDPEGICASYSAALDLEMGRNWQQLNLSISN